MITADAQRYWANHATSPSLLAEYRGSSGWPHRAWVVEGLGYLGTVETVLEVGCHCGPLLAYLGALGMRASGIDINTVAVGAAKAAGLTATVGSIPIALAQYGPGSVDAVVSSFSLAYIGPDYLIETLAEMLRIAARGIVIVEPMAGPGAPETAERQGSYVEWRHDYFPALDAVARLSGRVLELTRLARGPYAGINGIIIARPA